MYAVLYPGMALQFDYSILLSVLHRPPSQEHLSIQGCICETLPRTLLSCYTAVVVVWSLQHPFRFCILSPRPVCTYCFRRGFPSYFAERLSSYGWHTYSADQEPVGLFLLETRLRQLGEDLLTAIQWSSTSVPGKSKLIYPNKYSTKTTQQNTRPQGCRLFLGFTCIFLCNRLVCRILPAEFLCTSNTVFDQLLFY